MMSKKHEWIDIVKGIGILSIVIGHISDGLLREVLFLFHVPLFYFLSGYLFRQPNTLTSFVSKKSKTLLIPYISFLTVFVLLLLLKDWSKTHEINTSLIHDALFGGQKLAGELSVFWFITSLFLTQVTFALINHFFDKKSVLLIILALLTLAYATEHFMQNRTFYLAVNTILYSLPFFYAGYIYKGVSASTIRIINKLCIVYTAVIIFWFSVMPEIFYIDIKYSILGMPVISLLLSISLSIIIFIFSQRIRNLGVITKCFSMLGVMSMTIMYLHQPLQITLRHGLGVTHLALLLSITISGCCFIHLFLERFYIGRVFFLGLKK